MKVFKIRRRNALQANVLITGTIVLVISLFILNHNLSTILNRNERFLGVKNARDSFRIKSSTILSTKLSNNSKSYEEIDFTSSESPVFRKILKRALYNQQKCNNEIDKEIKNTMQEFVNESKYFLLPKFGIMDAIHAYYNTTTYSPSTNSENSNNNEYHDYPYNCKLPPKTSCNETGYTVVLMAYKKSKITKLMEGLKILYSRQPMVQQIVLVWNSPKDDLISLSQEKTKTNPYELLLQYDKDPENILRIHYTQSNNLFNRYHPSVLHAKKQKIKSKAILYFDDDGPYYTSQTVNAGFELWKRNSNVPVSCYTRNYRFQTITQPYEYTNIRMIQDMKYAIHNRIQDELPTQQQQMQHQNNINNNDFITFCPSNGDLLNYNYNKITPQFGSHHFLPSGTFIHVDFLCFLWHPIFHEIRDFVLTHPTRPDDVAVSSILSQVSGLNFKIYPIKIFNHTKKKEDNSINESISNKNNNNEHNLNHRKLLWNKNDWPNMRTEAINSIIGYFGSIQSGSIGWCVGTSYLFQEVNEVESITKQTKTLPLVQKCTKDRPTLADMPWLNKGGVSYDQC